LINLWGNPSKNLEKPYKYTWKSELKKEEEKEKKKMGKYYVNRPYFEGLIT
jgi:hypothetical protein